MGDPSFSVIFESHGVTIEVVSDDPDVFAAVPAALPPAAGPGDPARATKQFGVMADGSRTVDGAVVAQGPRDVGRSLVVLASEIRDHLAVEAPEHMFVHAGVVCIDDTAIVLPGSSLSGKTSLVAALLAAGATYYSDEYAIVDVTGFILPYPKPLSIRIEPDYPAMTVPHNVPVAQIGVTPVRAGLVVLTRYVPAAVWRPRTCTRAEGMLGILEHTIAARSDPDRAIAAVGELVRDARILAGDRGAAGPVAAALLGEVSRLQR